MVNSETITRWLTIFLISLVAFIPALAADAPSGVAWLQGHQTTSSTNLNQSTAYAISWSNAYFDPSYFTNSASPNPQRLTVKQDGDYLVAVTIPVESDFTMVDNYDRITILAEVYTNGVPAEGAVGSSSFMRNYTLGHNESSDHINVLLKGLKANDYIEVFVKGGLTDNVGAYYYVKVSGQASIYVEYIGIDRTVFSGTATRTDASATELNAEASPLRWTAVRTNAGITHTSGTSSITLDQAGDYLVFVNMPLYSTTVRASVKLRVKIDGTTVKGGQGCQGYIRADADYCDGPYTSSVHWAGMITNVGADAVLTVSAEQDAGAGTVTVGGKKGSIYIERIDTSQSIYFGRGTDLTGGTEWNPASTQGIKWENDDIIDTNIFTHSTSVNPHEITVKQEGDYVLVYNDSLTYGSGDGRSNPKIKVNINDSPLSGAETKSHYIRNASGHTNSSGCLVYFLTGLTNGSKITLTVERESTADELDDDDDALLFLWYKGIPGAPQISNQSATNIAAFTADLAGNLTSTGAAPTEVYCYWGQTNGYTTKGDWATNDYLGTNDVGLLTNIVSDLTGGTLYYYRFYATNSAGDDWADSSELFSTLGAPTVNNDGGATNVTATSATLRGEVIGGNPTPDVYICWGDNDGGGTGTGDWDYVEDMGTQLGDFSTNISGLLASQTNYYRCFATNSNGGAWAPATTNFTTDEPTLSINDPPGVREGDSGTTNAVFTVTLSATSVVDVTVGFATSNGTAAAGTDFVTTAGTLTIEAGVVSNTITVVVNGDVEDEFPSENFYVDLSNAANATISDSQGEGTIGDDDGITKRLVLQQGLVPAINGVPIAGADSYTGTVDTYVDKDYPTTSYGDATILCFGRHNTFDHVDHPEDYETTHAWMRFESFTNYLPANAAIIRARLYLTSAGDGPYTWANVLRFMTAAWTTNMTWDSHTTTGVDIGSIRANAYGYASEIWELNEIEWLDMTAMVQAWHSGERANRGIVFRSNMGNQRYIERRCFSSEYGTVSKRPRLDIDYVTGESIVGSGSWFEGLVVITNGPSVFEDTYIKSNAVNYASDTYAPSLRTCSAELMPERILIRIKMDNPLLSTLAKTGEMAADKPILVAAQLQFNDLYVGREYNLDIWKLSQDWIVNQATGGTGAGTRDGTNAWDQVWVKDINNIDGARVARSSSDDIFQAGTRIFDITTVLQGYVDGSNNYGFVVGRTGGDGTYEMGVYLTEIGYSFLRPTLVLQLKASGPRGTMIKIR